MSYGSSDRRIKESMGFKLCGGRNIIRIPPFNINRLQIQRQGTAASITSSKH
jgi:hypothetical protein